ncbi:aminotransferase class III-fold pyridoxal phosphate-dependent enzyme [Pseudoalteromonas sp. NEC-BIFX-2020_002]|uniref:aminotransferase class III-fold pyridoxal phosphate-dependent enzyme n=1 Tax=Pseudoalteromonas sp. NEC-BIFX-2020_002 TaxID=2732353 RepID=UPI001476E0D4|nr:aminotransferase class III-fold pyridoxal phosphate-dependent enzyme [Pseudoalteromonas sp. NEC-BIFX-2020_002]NNG41920.1 aminotransferase class III-fold pyridoxal phosphate-dependent enzyme [Pseudoalteromonas sp. NEC-BIFX-2020_002]
MNRYSQYCKPSLNHGIYAMGLDRVFHRAEKGTMFYFDEQGNECEVIDFLGGYGAALIGHNNPKMIQAATANFQQQIAFHNQFSVRDAASELAERLNVILKTENQLHDDFYFSFTSTGAESIEVAIKHAEMARRNETQYFVEEMQFSISQLHRATKVVEPVLSDEQQQLLGLSTAVNIDEFIAAVRSYNEQQLCLQPYFVVLKNAFHGKLMTSIQLTHGEMYRAPFAHLGVQSEFIAVNELNTVLSALNKKHFATLLMPKLKGNTVKLITQPLRLATAILVEPVQGEGGIHCLTVEHSQHLKKLSQALDCPIISDEIQSGSGRCGALTAGSEIGLKADYFVLSKALAGGIAKLGLVAIRKSKYQAGFDIIQSSTFGEDDHSARIALAFLDELYDPQQNLLARIKDQGEHIKVRLIELQASYPELIKEVRGKGLLIGIEFNADMALDSIWLKSILYQGFLGYMITGYLFNNYHIRVAPSSSAPNVVRLEPTIHVTELEIDQLITGLEDVCKVLQYQDSYHFLKHLTKEAKTRSTRAELADFRAFYSGLQQSDNEADVKVAFVNHLISADWIWQVDPAMEGVPEVEAKLLIERLGFDWRVAPLPPMRITSTAGKTVDFILYPLSVTSEQISVMLQNNELDAIRRAVSERAQTAQRDGCSVAGFGMFTSVVSNNCKSIRATDIALTSGNALTVGMTKLAVLEQIKARNVHVDKVAVIGSAGNIGSVYATVMAEHCQQLVLVGSARMGSKKRLLKAAYKIYSDIWDSVKTQSSLTGLIKKVAEHPQCQHWLADEARCPSDIASALFELFSQDMNGLVVIADELSEAYDCSVIVCATNASEAILDVSKLMSNALICDVSIPHNLSNEDLALRPDVSCIRGGIVGTPNGESLDARARAYLDPGQIYACMAESVILGLEGVQQHYSYGDLSKPQVDEILVMAQRQGFFLAGSKDKGSM